MGKFQSSKVFDGFSTVFRQWRAKETHCRFVHGYDAAGVAQVRVIPATGAEKFAEYIYTKLNDFVKTETDGRVRVTKVKFAEHGKNAAYYSE